MTAQWAATVPDGSGSTPCVGIVVPAFNAARYLDETLRSVAAQTYRAWQCVVVDDGSADDTALIAARFAADDARFRLLQQPNGGVSSARNAALAVLPDTVTLLAFLDSDDLWLPDSLAVLVAHLDGEPAAAGVYGVAEYIDEAGHPLRTGAHRAVQSDRRRLGRFDLVDVPHGARSTFATMIVSGTIWPPATALFRRAAVDEAGGFDAAQPYVEDWDLYVRMSRRADFVPLDRQTAWYRQHGTNITKHDEKMAYYHARVRWKAWSSSDNTPEQYRLSQRTWRRLQARWIYWSVGAVLGAIRARDWRTTRDAAGAVDLFTRQLLVGHPAEPDARMARLVTRFVAPRSAGKGSTDA